MSELITNDMPEPMNTSMLFISWGDGCYGTLAGTNEDGEWLELGNDHCMTWGEFSEEHRGHEMETLEEHDARIRREALTLSDDECSVIVDALLSDGVLTTPKAIRAALTEIAENREPES